MHYTTTSTTSTSTSCICVLCTMAELSTSSCPTMDIQCNWDEEFRNGKFWVSCRHPDGKTLHGSLSKPSSSSRQEGGFVIRDHSQHSITVACPEANITTTFVRPRSVRHLHDRKLLCADVSASGGLGVASSEDGKLWVWDADSGETRRSLDGHVGDVYTCRLFPSGVVVLSAGADLRLRIWSAQDGSCARTLLGHTRGITDTAIVDRGKNIVSVSSDGTAKLWDCGTGKTLATISTTKCPINACALDVCSLMANKNTSPPVEPECGTSDKLLILACEDGVLRGCDVRNKESFMACGVGESPLSSCVFVSDLQVLSGGEDGVINLIDLRKNDKPVNRVSFGRSTVTSLLPLSESRCLAGMSDGSCVAWSMSSDHVTVTKLTGPDIDPITSVSKSVGKVYTSCRDGLVRVYNCADIL